MYKNPCVYVPILRSLIWGKFCTFRGPFGHFIRISVANSLTACIHCIFSIFTVFFHCLFTVSPIAWCCDAVLAAEIQTHQMAPLDTAERSRLEGIQLKPEANNKLNSLPIRLCFINVYNYTYSNPKPIPLTTMQIQ